MARLDYAFLDSGIGGLPYMRTLRRLRPSASMVYLADIAHFPYGPRCPKEICALSKELIQKVNCLWQPLVLVIACNTISTLALEELREHYKGLHIVGTVPAIKLAASISRNKHIGLLATKATIEDAYTKELIAKYASAEQGYTVESIAAAKLVDFVEHRLFSPSVTLEETERIVRYYMEDFSNKGCDTVVLGCTHFTHLASNFTSVAQGLLDTIAPISIVDSREGVARQAIAVREALGVDCNPTKEAVVPYFFITHSETATQQRRLYENICSKLGLHYGGVV